jgi:quercetin dioxygenase-like cupin family protein
MSAKSFVLAIALLCTAPPALAQDAPAAVPEVKVMDIAAAPPETVAPGLTRRYLFGTDVTFAIFHFDKGAVVPTHSHPNEQVSYIPSGHVRVTAGGKVHELRGGQVIIIPPNVPHSFEAIERTVDIDFFTPARADWLSGSAGYFTVPARPASDAKPGE